MAQDKSAADTVDRSPAASPQERVDINSLLAHLRLLPIELIHNILIYIRPSHLRVFEDVDDSTFAPIALSLKHRVIDILCDSTESPASLASFRSLADDPATAPKIKEICFARSGDLNEPSDDMRCHDVVGLRKRLRSLPNLVEMSFSGDWPSMYLQKTVAMLSECSRWITACDIEVSFKSVGDAGNCLSPTIRGLRVMDSDINFGVDTGDYRQIKARSPVGETNNAHMLYRLHSAGPIYPEFYYFTYYWLDRLEIHNIIIHAPTLVHYLKTDRALSHLHLHDSMLSVHGNLWDRCPLTMLLDGIITFILVNNLTTPRAMPHISFNSISKLGWEGELTISEAEFKKVAGGDGPFDRDLWIRDISRKFKLPARYEVKKIEESRLLEILCESQSTLFFMEMIQGPAGRRPRWKHTYDVGDEEPNSGLIEGIFPFNEDGPCLMIRDKELHAKLHEAKKEIGQQM